MAVKTADAHIGQSSRLQGPLHTLACHLDPRAMLSQVHLALVHAGLAIQSMAAWLQKHE